jgi:hypothetical protein
MSDYQLTTELMKLSFSQKWDEAKLEWQLIDIEKVEEAESCLCGHYPILEICTIKNIKINNQVRVGNCCVKKFNNQSDKIFKAISRVKKDKTKSLNAETIDFARKKGYVSEWEKNFYVDIMRKRNLSLNQSSKKESVNNKILSKMKI